MSRRASLLAKQIPEEKKPKGVRFPDELVFLDNIKENDVHALGSMLRRASLQVDISAINVAGLTPLHQAVLDGNEAAVRLLVAHGATVNKQDEDSWTPLHAACAEGHADIAKFLLESGADRNILTDEGERPLDLVEPSDLPTIRVMLSDVKPNTDNQSDDDFDDDVTHNDGLQDVTLNGAPSSAPNLVQGFNGASANENVC
ncbi:PPR27-like protein [Mya arenaria]|uniref:PPR27-like protein n=1 Tax=Mya arenaria TaxID=6604 RepID=A0ABY7FGP7_MYAAR|nr:PPR27-like protein [Mya arenaria]